MDHCHWFTILDLHWFFISKCSKICDATSCLNAKMNTHSRRVWALSLYYWPCLYTCETGPPFVPIPYKSFLLQSFSLHKSWRTVSCMTKINCLAIKGYQDTRVDPSCNFIKIFLKSNRWMKNETICMYFWFSNIF